MTPEHYDMEIQPITYIMANGLGFCEGNIVKYVSRYKEKGEIDDLHKAKYYIEILIAEYGGENQNHGSTFKEGWNKMIVEEQMKDLDRVNRIAEEWNRGSAK